MQNSPTNVLHRKTMLIRTAALVLVLTTMMLLSQTVFAQNTYVITDGDRVVVHTTAATDPAAVLNEAGLALGADDTYTTQPGLGVSEITVQRSQLVTVDNCGEVLEINTLDETVEALLSTLNIDVNAGTSLSVPLDTLITDGMTLTIVQTEHQTQTYTASIPYETTYYDDATLPVGTQVVVTPGKTGQLQCKADVVYTNGTETERTVFEETVLNQPVNEVIAVGTAAEPPVATPPRASDGIVIDGSTIKLPSGEVLTYRASEKFVATAYTHTDPGCDFITATGTTVHIGTVAVDPTIIPYGTRMFIMANDGSYVYGISTAEDCGGSIKGNRIDLYYPTYDECIQFGIRDCTIYFLG